MPLTLQHSSVRLLLRQPAKVIPVLRECMTCSCSEDMIFLERSVICEVAVETSFDPSSDAIEGPSPPVVLRKPPVAHQCYAYNAFKSARIVSANHRPA